MGKCDPTTTPMLLCEFDEVANTTDIVPYSAFQETRLCEIREDVAVAAISVIDRHC